MSISEQSLTPTITKHPELSRDEFFGALATRETADDLHWLTFDRLLEVETANRSLLEEKEAQIALAYAQLLTSLKKQQNHDEDMNDLYAGCMPAAGHTRQGTSLAEERVQLSRARLQALETERDDITATLAIVEIVFDYVTEWRDYLFQLSSSQANGQLSQHEEPRISEELWDAICLVLKP
jgi:hypothetical protein